MCRLLLSNCLFLFSLCSLLLLLLLPSVPIWRKITATVSRSCNNSGVCWGQGLVGEGWSRHFSS